MVDGGRHNITDRTRALIFAPQLFNFTDEITCQLVNFTELDGQEEKKI